MRSILTILPLVGLAFCAPPIDAPTQDEVGQELSSDNGLSPNGLSPNGLSANGLSGNGLSGNGLSNNGLSSNGLSNNGLSSNGFKGWFDSGNNNATSHAYAAQLMKYLVRCACGSGVTRTFTDPATGIGYSWAGNLGLATGWCGGAAATLAEQQWVTACLLAHTNVLANPTAPVPVSLQISVRTPSTERSLPSSEEELHSLAYSEGVYFGNIFNQGDTSSPKGAYAGRGWTDGFGYWGATEFGRRCFNDGCPGGNGITLFGSSGPYSHTPDNTLQYIPGYNGTIQCTSNANCTGTNNGVTPVCTKVNGWSYGYCTTRQKRCTTVADAYGNPIPSSCLDPSARSWGRVLSVYLPRFIDAALTSGTYDLEQGQSYGYCTGSLAEQCIKGVKSGVTVTLAELAYGSSLSSSYHKVRVRYRGTGSLKIGRTDENAWPTTTWYSTQALSCATGKWCWAEWTGVHFVGNSATNYVMAQGASTSATDIDIITIGATR